MELEYALIALFLDCTKLTNLKPYKNSKTKRKVNKAFFFLSSLANKYNKFDNIVIRHKDKQSRV
jgi:hypothetical protein